MKTENIDFKLFLLYGMSAMLLLFVSLLFIFIFSQRKKLQYQKTLHDIQSKQQHQLVEAAVKSEETERHRIAEQLHDEVGALLSSSKLHFKTMKMDNKDGNSLSLFDKGNELLDESINKIRGISHDLHSHILEEFGLNDAIKHFAENITNSSLIRITTELDYSYVSNWPEKDVALYRIVQELLNNIFKHSMAGKIHISSTYKNYNLTIELINDGKGLSQENFEKFRYTKNGLGLKNIQNRINLLKGTITFENIANDYHTKIFIPSINEQAN
jgi:signal transduction histidine kinase